MQSKKEEIEHKYSHLLQILETERAEKWQLLKQCEDQGQQLKDLRLEVNILFHRSTAHTLLQNKRFKLGVSPLH